MSTALAQPSSDGQHDDHPDLDERRSRSGRPGRRRGPSSRPGRRGASGAWAGRRRGRPANRPRTMTGRNWAAATTPEPERVAAVSWQDEPAPGRPAASRSRRARSPGRRRTAGSCGGGTRDRPSAARERRGGRIVIGGSLGGRRRARDAGRARRRARRGGRRGGAGGASASSIIVVEAGALGSRGSRSGDRPGRARRARIGPCARPGRWVARKRSRLRSRAASSSSSWPIWARLNPASSRRLLDEPEALEVGLVEQPVGAVGAGGRLEQPELLVVADRARRQAGLGGDLLDPQEAPGLGGSWWRVGHPPMLPQP